MGEAVKGCQHCGRTDDDRPTIFRGELWCSDRCRKALGLWT
jgi:hypothetical protein